MSGAGAHIVDVESLCRYIGGGHRSVTETFALGTCINKMFYVFFFNCRDDVRAAGAPHPAPHRAPPRRTPLTWNIRKDNKFPRHKPTY